MRTFTTAAVLSLSAFACSSTTSGSGASGSGGAGSNRVALDVDAFCEKAVTECKQSITRESCERTFRVFRVSADCPSQLETATCADLASNNSAAAQACFPSCTSPDTQSCNGDGTITICATTKQTFVADCAATCESIGKTYSGTCGLTFQGQTGEGNKDKCWCQ